MKCSFAGALVIASGVSVLLSGCNGSTFDELQKAPVAVQRDTAKPRAQVAGCLIDALSKFGSDLGRFPDIDPGVTRLILGGNDSYHYRDYYRIDIVDRFPGSRVSVSHSKAQDNNMSLSELTGIVDQCVK